MAFRKLNISTVNPVTCGNLYQASSIACKLPQPKKRGRSPLMLVRECAWVAYTTPCASMASATFTKPAMLAPSM
jgi:hypothetical protein